MTPQTPLTSHLREKGLGVFVRSSQEALGLFVPELCTPGKPAPAKPVLSLFSYPHQENEGPCPSIKKTKEPPGHPQQTQIYSKMSFCFSLFKKAAGALSSLLKNIAAYHIELSGIDAEPLGRY